MNSNVLGEEFLGKKITVLKSTNVNITGLEGIVIKETKNTFHILKGDKEKVIPKNVCQFLIEKDDKKSFEVEGKIICYKPENRLKELRRINKNLKRMN
jgi:ribonuclease P protein subunit POP4